MNASIEKITIGLYISGQRGLVSLEELITSGRVNVVYAFVARKGAEDPFFEKILQVLGSEGVRLASDGEGLEQVHARLAVAWGRKISIDQEDNLFVIHDSLLPKLRGFSPLVHAIRAGFERTGVTLFKAVDEIDAGPIVRQISFQLEPQMSLSIAMEQTNPLYRALCRSLIDYLGSGSEAALKPQNHDEATYCQWLDYDDYFLDFSLTAPEVARHARSVGSPFSGPLVRTTNGVFRVQDVLEAADRQLVNRSPGKVFETHEGDLVVVCREGMVRLSGLTQLEVGVQDFNPGLKTRFMGIGNLAITLA